MLFFSFYSEILISLGSTRKAKCPPNKEISNPFKTENFYNLISDEMCPVGKQPLDLS